MQQLQQNRQSNAPVNQHILIVDDVPSNIEVLAAALESDYELQFALSGEQALAMIAEEAPDLVLLDIMMPGMDGLETLRRLRAREASQGEGHETSVILITADNRPETQVQGLSLGAQDFLTKPVELTVMRARVVNVLERRRLNDETASLLAKLEAANHALANMSELNSVLLASAGEGIYSVDLNGVCTSANPAAKKLLGCSEAEIVGHDQHARFHHHRPDGSVYSKEDCPVSQTLRDGLVRSAEDVFIRQDGSWLPVLLTVTPMVLEGTRVGAEVLFQDITERQRTTRELFRLATTDSLTGTLNRRRFFELGEAECKRVERYGMATALLMLDLDYFKNINDQHGHSAGDAVLVQFATVVKNVLREVDIFGRLGGEEFAVLLLETDMAGAHVIAERLRQAVEAGRVANPAGDIAITVSIGVTALGVKEESLDQAMIRADRALYRAKAGGRNQTVSER